jgi:hypothetical protein
VSQADDKAYYAKVLRHSIAKVADRHRQIAETLDNLAARVDLIGTPGNAVASDLAASVVHEIAWISANGNPEQVVRMAADYDRNVLSSPPESAPEASDAR